VEFSSPVEAIRCAVSDTGGHRIRSRSGTLPTCSRIGERSRSRTL
jgi:hypothetical protein